MAELSNKFPENQKSPELLSRYVTTKEIMDKIKKDLEEKVRAWIITEEQKEEVICMFQLDCEKINYETREVITKMQDMHIDIEEWKDKTYEIEKDWQKFDAKFTEREILFNYKLPRFEWLKWKWIKYATLPHPSLVFWQMVKFDAKNLTLTWLIKKRPWDYNFTIIAYKGNEVLARRIWTITIESRDTETAWPYLYNDFDLDLYSNTSYESGYRLPKITDSTKNVEYKFDWLEILGKWVRYDEKRHELVWIIDCKPWEYLIWVTITDKNTWEVFKKTPLVTVRKLPDFVKSKK